MGSDLIYRGHEEPLPQAGGSASGGYSPKRDKRWLISSCRPIRYLLREQRLLFVLVGMAIASAFFRLAPVLSPFSSSPASSAAGGSYLPAPREVDNRFRSAYERDPVMDSGAGVFGHRLGGGMLAGATGGKIPLGLKRKNLRIVVTGGAGFVGSHLVDRLMERGDSVIVVDNFFTGRKENVMHHFRNPRFELIRHDVVEPLLLEVDQIYHLACPASPVHYKFNPVKTIISFFPFCFLMFLSASIISSILVIVFRTSADGDRVRFVSSLDGTEGFRSDFFCCVASAENGRLTYSMFLWLPHSDL